MHVCGRLVLDFFEMWEVQVKKNKQDHCQGSYVCILFYANIIVSQLHYFIFNINLLRKPIDTAHIRNVTILLIWHQIFLEIILKSLSIGNSLFSKMMFRYLKIGSVNFHPAYTLFFFIPSSQLSCFKWFPARTDLQLLTICIFSDA